MDRVHYVLAYVEEHFCLPRRAPETEAKLLEVGLLYRQYDLVALTAAGQDALNAYKADAVKARMLGYDDQGDVW